MPELPEVEVVRHGLDPAVTGAAIEAIEVYDERSLRRHPGPAEDFIDRLTGARLDSAVRRGKFLWLPLRDEEGDPAEALVVHLGMSGQVLLRQRDADDGPLTRIRLDIVHPEHGPLRLNFVDQRIFGSMAIDALLPTPDGAAGGCGSAQPSIPSQVAHIARDPLDDAFDDRLFLRRLAARRTTIKRALLDQTLVSGIGNIYADEALWAARVHYDQPTEHLGPRRARTLLAEVRTVLRRALEEGGTSFDAQYVNVNGASGYFSHSLRAYGQQGRPCGRCGGLIVREQFMNRGSHFCPRCQRIRRIRSTTSLR
ncbi:bifunctional DNA-formamidopyrimidine glycosylase/DNA-(apurinic or apyrimidinic site) lyase [Chryseoglobus sp. 28M-23]|uniref:bifunctional DNA-formamidopyrimidine glycosylase/DNA-(apurinic or apyrimidinic site) lyase n=1 Tax=Chryseoglobus sp. 28M-23 TaxID=2772253 RepID=UPI001745F32E|nr:bifunctional DNA-formamidopyrimidine glycosylase/DNA-(apurinic or apyrimidinic site) lyase [Chryseoglobus sp. 28M-23]QOD94932.1 bifunctional DNA-formamidopyrimidine glycosylase/DNA-(apurinic or apyrimidinic site) lyase [Chryseoglobus sp. 28M-23]